MDHRAGSPPTQPLSTKLYAAGLEAYAEAGTSVPPQHIVELERATMAAGRAKIMLSDRCVGRLLAILSSTIRPRLAIDVGTFTGNSALSMAEGLAPEGRVVTCEIDAKQAEVARAHFARSPYEAKIELVVGDATATIRAQREPIDLAFIDGDKAEYWTYYEAVLERLSPRGLIVVDNTLALGTVLMDEGAAEYLSPLLAGFRRALLDFNQRVQADPRSECTFLAVSDGVTLIRKRAA